MAKDIEFTAKVAADLSQFARKDDLLKKLIDVWNSKNANSAKRVGSFGFMAAALAACGGGSSPTPTAPEADAPDFGVTFDGVLANITGVVAFLKDGKVYEATINEASAAPDSLLDAPVLVGAGVSLPEGTTGAVLKDGVTLVARVEDLDDATVSGNGNVWLLIGEDGTASGEYSATLDIRLSGGTITFDMPSDNHSLTLLAGTVINLNGGTLVVSDGKVFANAAEVQLLNIGNVVLNSELVITYDQFMLNSEDPNFSVSGTGKLTVLVENDEEAQQFFDALLENQAILGADAPTVVVENTALGVVTSVDVENIIDSKLAYLSTSIGTQIDALATQLQGQGYDAAAYKSLAVLSGALKALESQVASNATAAAEALSSAQGTLQAAIEKLASEAETAIADLQDQIEGGDLTNASFKTLLSISNALELLNATDGSTGSVLQTIADEIGVQSDAANNVTATGLWADIEKRLSTDLKALEAKIQGFAEANDYMSLALVMDDTNVPGNDTGEPTTNSIAGLKAALDALGSTGSNITALQGEISVLERNIADLQSQIDAIVAPGLIEANELDNRIELYEYDGDSSFIRVELNEGDDYLNSFSGETEIVGGAGADVINLTWNDQSVDTVIYQTVSDGQTRAVSTITFSDNVLDYREGSVLTLLVNDSEYSYTALLQNSDFRGFTS